MSIDCASQLPWWIDLPIFKMIKPILIQHKLHTNLEVLLGFKEKDFEDLGIDLISRQLLMKALPVLKTCLDTSSQNGFPGFPFSLMEELGAQTSGETTMSPVAVANDRSMPPISAPIVVVNPQLKNEVPSQKIRYEDSIAKYIGPYLKVLRRTYPDNPKKNPEVLVHKTIVNNYDRTQRELEHLNAKSQHPNIIRYACALKRSDADIEIDMEYADAGQIDIVMKRVHNLQQHIAVVKCVARQLFCGLLYYHEVHNRSHHDISPANVVVRSDGTVKVCAFDNARNSSLPFDWDRIYRNRSYFAPERMTNFRTVKGELPLIDSEKSDVWSAAMTIFSLVVGKNPEQLGIDPSEAPTKTEIEQLPWDFFVTNNDKSLEYLLRRCLKMSINERATLAEACAITFVVHNQGETANKDPWMDNGFVIPNDQLTKLKEHNIQLCDEIVRQTYCTVSSENLVENVATASTAMVAELKLWKHQRELSDSKREAVDPIMKEVIKLRCKRTREIFREAARLKEVMEQTEALRIGPITAVAV